MIGQFFTAYDLRLYCRTHRALCVILIILEPLRKIYAIGWNCNI